MKALRSLLPAPILAQAGRGHRRGAYAAAAVFADVQGFTALTERLMAHGKEGAEVLTAVLNRVFRPVVSDVATHGGFVSTFAGDALTAVFPLRRRDARRHALAVADAVVRHVREAAALETPFGPCDLSVRVGVAAGPLAWGLVGRGARRAYFVRGPAVDEAAGAQEHAAPGWIVASLTAVEGLGPDVGLAAVETSALHRRVVHVPRVPAVRRRAGAAIAPDVGRAFVPSAILALEDEGEFREVAVAFISFEAPRSDDVLDRFASEVLRLCEAYGGYLNKLDFGDKGGVMLLLFGAPVAHEDDAIRAARTLLDLKRGSEGLSWRAGLAHGTVYAGFVGGSARCEYTAMGDVVNTAARLMGRGAWGEILLTERARCAMGAAVETEARGALALKGMAEPVPAHALLRTVTAGRASRFEGPCVGRRAEIAAIDAFLTTPQDGERVGVVHVTGEAGIGKSRLVHEIRRRQQDGRLWLQGAADELVPRPFGPFVRILQERLLPADVAQDPTARREAFESRWEGLRTRCAAAGAALGLPAADVLAELVRTKSVLAALLDLESPGVLWEALDPQGRHENSVAALVTFLRAEGLAAPLVVEIEDGHAMDPASREVLAAVADRAFLAPLAVVVTSRLRDDGSEPDLGLHADARRLTVDLGRMTREDLGLLAEAELGGRVGPALLALLPERTEGNPFYALQLVRYLRERRRLVRGEEGWELRAGSADVPATIQAVLVARIDRLSSALKGAVKAASVLGRSFEVVLLSRMIRGDAEPLLEEGDVERLWASVSDVEYEFRHAMLRDVAYEMQLRARLRELHARAAEAICTTHGPDVPGRFADLAWHYERAADDAQAIHYLRRAADHAKGTFQNAQAIDFLDRLLARLGEGASAAQPRCAARLQQADVLILVGRAEEALRLADLVRTEVERAPALPFLAQAALVQGSALEELGRYEDAILRYRESRAAATGAADGRAEAAALGNEGECHRFQGRFAEALACYEAARDLDAAVGNAAGLQRHANNIGIIFAMRGEDDRALATFEAGLDAARDAGDRQGEARALTNLGIIERRSGRLDAALDHYTRALELATEVGSRRLQAMITGNVGNLLMAKEEWGRAVQAQERALGTSREIGDPLGVLRARGNRAIALGHLGRRDEAVRDFDEALDEARRLDARDLEVFFAHEYARLLLETGAVADAATWNEHAETVASTIGYTAIADQLRELGERIASHTEPGS